MSYPSHSDVIAVLQQLAPIEDALPGDPVGLLLEGENRPVRRIGVCLDCTPAAARRAAAWMPGCVRLTANPDPCDLVVAHHPLIYHPLRRIVPSLDPVADSVAVLLRAGIALWAMHTNWDRANGGINDTLARQLGLHDFRPLGVEGIKALPRIGVLADPLPAAEFCSLVDTVLGCRESSAIRVGGGGPEVVATVGVCGGAGADLAADIIAAGADAYVTSDIRHHEFLDAAARGLLLIDAGHGATETPGMRELIPILREAFPQVDVVWIGEDPVT